MAAAALQGRANAMTPAMDAISVVDAISIVLTAKILTAMFAFVTLENAGLHC
jgi:hypothetical protein